MNKKTNLNENGKSNVMDELIELGTGIEFPPDVNLQLPDPSLVTYYKNYNDRVIWIDKEIDDSLFEEIRMIILWNLEDEKKNIPVEERKEIKLMIHSYGGSLDSCFTMIDTMALSKTPIKTVNVNSALSAGCLIFINGHKGRRYCFPKSTALIHQGSGGSQGSFEAVTAQTENYKKMVSMMKNNILEHTNITKQILNKKFKQEWYMYAEDQIQFGLADHIVNDITELF